MQFASRYIFEHLVFAHLYFPEVDSRKFFQLVRSATPPGEPIQLIATRRPYNDPGVSRVYYRIREHNETIVAKTHMPYRLDRERMQRWQTLFHRRQYDVTELPSYDEQTASNPFLTFQRIAGSFALRVHARRGPVHDHGIYQGTGLPRAGRTERHQRSFLGVFR